MDSYLARTATAACQIHEHYTSFFFNGAVNGVPGVCKEWLTEEQCMRHKTNHPAEDPIIECVNYYLNSYNTYNHTDCSPGCDNGLNKQDAMLINAMAAPTGSGSSGFCHCAPDGTHGGGI